LDANSTPFSSGIEFRNPSRAAFKASPFAMLISFLAPFGACQAGARAVCAVTDQQQY
jgi:hypothetical protein